MSDDKVSDMTGDNVVDTLKETLSPEEPTEDEKLNLIVEKAAARIKARRTFNDGWVVMKDVGEAFGGYWPVGTLVASVKEFGEAFDCQPWINGSSVTGCAKGKMRVEYGVKDPEGREWTFFTELRLNDIDDKKELQMSWSVNGTDDVSLVGQFLANRFQRTVATREDSGPTSVFFHVVREMPEEVG